MPPRKIVTGGPAGENLTVRDLMAAQIAAQLVHTMDPTAGIKALARSAYQIADALMVERENT